MPSPLLRSESRHAARSISNDKRAVLDDYIARSTTSQAAELASRRSLSSSSEINSKTLMKRGAQGVALVLGRSSKCLSAVAPYESS